MALDFTAATTNKVTVTNPQTFGAGSAFSWCMWIMRTAALSNTQGMSKGGVDLFVFSTTGTVMFFNIPRATTGSNAKVLSSAFVLNEWEFWAGTYDETDGPRLFKGTLTSPVAEVTYSARVVGAGNTTADSGNLFINNRGAANVLAIGARIGTFNWFNRRLSLAELAQQQWQPLPASGSQFFGHLGYDAANSVVADLSGNGRNGSITGAAIAAHVPLGSPTRRILARARPLGNFVIALGASAAAAVFSETAALKRLRGSTASNGQAWSALSILGRLRVSISATAAIWGEIAIIGRIRGLAASGGQIWSEGATLTRRRGFVSSAAQNWAEVSALVRLRGCIAAGSAQWSAVSVIYRKRGGASSTGSIWNALAVISGASGSLVAQAAFSFGSTAALGVKRGFVSAAAMSFAESAVISIIEPPFVPHGPIIRFKREGMSFPRAVREDRRRKF